MGKEFLQDVLTLEEDQFMEKYQSITYLDFKQKARIALLEQDRDTRHAITEEITTSDCITDQQEKDRVCSIVMNCCKGVQQEWLQ